MHFFQKKLQQAESGSMLERGDVDYDPMLQITDASTKFRKFALHLLEHTQNKTRFKDQIKTEIALQ